MALRVLIADDHPLFRHGLRAALEARPDVVVVAEAADGREAIEQIRVHDPDVAILDLSMPELDGLEVLAQAATWPRAPSFVVLTMHDAYASRAFELGALGYVLKEDATAEIVTCVERVVRGERFVSPALAGASAAEVAAPAIEELSAAERRVLRLVGQHKTSREIAEVLHLSPRTVQNHRANMCRKLGLEGSQALLRFALEHRDALDPL